MARLQNFDTNNLYRDIEHSLREKVSQEHMIEVVTNYLSTLQNNYGYNWFDNFLKLYSSRTYNTPGRSMQILTEQLSNQYAIQFEDNYKNDLKEIEAFQDVTIDAKSNESMNATLRTLIELVFSTFGFKETKLSETINNQEVIGFVLDSNGFQEYYHLLKLTEDIAWQNMYFRETGQNAQFLLKKITSCLERLLEEHRLNNGNFGYRQPMIERLSLVSQVGEMPYETYSMRFTLPNINDEAFTQYASFWLLRLSVISDLFKSLRVLEEFYPTLHKELEEFYTANEQENSEEKQAAKDLFEIKLKENIVNLDDIQHKSGTAYCEKNGIAKLFKPLKANETTLPVDTPVVVYADKKTQEWSIHLVIDNLIEDNQDVVYKGIFYYFGYSKRFKKHAIRVDTESKEMFYANLDALNANHLLKSHEGFDEELRELLTTSFELETMYPMIFSNVTLSKTRMAEEGFPDAEVAPLSTQIEETKERITHTFDEISFYAMKLGDSNTIYHIHLPYDNRNVVDKYVVMPINNSVETTQILDGEDIRSDYKVISAKDLTTLETSVFEIEPKFYPGILKALEGSTGFDIGFVHKMLMTINENKFNTNNVRAYVFEKYMVLTKGTRFLDYHLITERYYDSSDEAKIILSNYFGQCDDEGYFSSGNFTMIPLYTNNMNNESAIFYNGVSFLN